MSFLMLTAVACFAGAANALDCVQIPDISIKQGNLAVLPGGATAPVAIPPNYDCTYNIKVPSGLWAHVTVENYLRGGNDLITANDAQGMKTLMSSRNTGQNSLYVFPNTTTTIRVTTRSVDVQSKFRITVFYSPVLPALVNKLNDNSDSLDYYFLRNLQLNAYYQPVTVIGQQQLALTIAQSHWDADIFTNFYIVDGDLEQNKGVYHMSQFVGQPFLSSGNKLTVLGLDNRVSQSAVFFTPLSEFMKFDSLEGTVTYWQQNTITIDATNGLKKAMTVISNDNDKTIILSMTINGTPAPNCSILAVETPATPNSPVIVDFRKIQSFRYTLERKKFVILVENCSVTFTMASPAPVETTTTPTH